MIFAVVGMFRVFRAPVMRSWARLRVCSRRAMRGRMSGAQSGGWAGLVRPMLATPARELPADEQSWAAEFKWDGLRAVAYVSGGVLLLRSRLDRDITATYPDLAAVASRAGAVS